ncbi:MAG: phosphoglucosamine mutase [Selenomonadaceae bacterium]|nr:phosphoglucosamine mutase [Selenomonadaceae bacterium]MBQ4403847.1 phosphoglucosamine mutase [Selenomonadaceae bacterium]
MARLFGTDGVRGEANTELPPELAFRMGRAATIYFGQHSEGTPQILIGRDTRISGEMLEAALVAGICSAGGNAILAGVIPTPAVAYLARKLHAAAGIVISASHNPFQDNGIKFFGGNGYKLPDKVEDEIEKIVRDMESGREFERPTGEGVGHIEYRQNLLEDYISFVMNTTSERFDGMKIVLDCANGAAYKSMPTVLERLGANLILLGNRPNGNNINDNCGSTHMENLRLEVLRNRADIGIAHDGDADRCLCIDERGEIIDGDHIMIICAKLMLKVGALPKKTIVATVMSNIGFRQALEELNLACEITAVGDRYVLENMRANGYNLGGEQSGHIIFSDYSTTGDGLITALQVLTAMKKFKATASELNALMTTYPQVLLNVRVQDKEACKNSAAVKLAIAEGEAELGTSGRILVRASGTEPLIRVMAEGRDKNQLNRICNKIAAEVEKVSG